MALLKNASISCYFKPSVPNCPKKRPLPADIVEEPRVKKHLPVTISKTFKPRSDQNGSSQSSKSSVDGSPVSNPSRSLSPQASSHSAAMSDKHTTLATSDDATAPEVSLNSLSDAFGPEKVPQNLPPASSQTQHFSSQRIVKNGEVMIRNSDDESNSDTSLEDLAELFGKKRPDSPTQLHSECSNLATSQEVDRNNDIGKRETKRRGRPRKFSPLSQASLPMIPEPRFSFAALAQQREQYDASQYGVAQANSLFELYNQRKGGADLRHGNGKVDIDTLDSMIGEDGDNHEKHKLKDAIRRTEALQYGKSWSFFDEHSEEPSLNQADFPAVQDKYLGPLLSNNRTRQQAFLCGFVGEFMEKDSLPEELLFWIMDAVCFESRDDLRYSYTMTLKGAVEQISPLLTPLRIDMLFQQLGASAAALAMKKPVVARPMTSLSVEHKRRPRLLSLLSILESFASTDIGPNSRIHMFCILCRLALDYSILQDCHARRAIERLFETLIESIPERDYQQEIHEILSSVYDVVSDSGLRLQLLHSIPALPPRLTVLRQRLALAFYFQDQGYLDRIQEDAVDLNLITCRLQSSQFAVTATTDYAELSAAIGILNIGIDSGNPPPFRTKNEEAAYNKDVDDLAATVQLLFASIRDTGVLHMKRTEAKELLESLQARLLFSVRTQPKLKNLHFGDSVVNNRLIDEFLEVGKPTG